MRLGVCLGNNAQPPKPPDLEGASTWYHKDDPFGPSGDRGGQLSSCSPEAITWHHSNGDSGAVGFFTLLLQVPCPRAGQTASYPTTAPLTSSPDLVLPFTFQPFIFTSQPFFLSLLYVLMSTSVSSQINNFKLLFPARHQI